MSKPKCEHVWHRYDDMVGCTKCNYWRRCDDDGNLIPRAKPRPPQAMVFITFCRICGTEVYRTEPIRYRGRQKIKDRITEEKRLAFVKHRIGAGHTFKYVAQDRPGWVTPNPIDIQLQDIWVDAASGDDELEIQGTDPEAVARRRAMHIPGPLAVMRLLNGEE